jgi:hypothetical protein
MSLIQDRVQELKAEARPNQNRAQGESNLVAKIAEMSEPQRTMPKRLHAIIIGSATALPPNRQGSARS